MHELPTRLWKKLQGRYRGNASSLLYKRPLLLRSPYPLISFTFDDFPESAWRVGGEVLRRFDVRGTYYAAFGLMGKTTPNSKMFSAEDARCLVENGHELGCHTFDHYHAWQTEPAEFEASILRNRRALDEFIPGASFSTLSYPFSQPRPLNKKAAGKYFLCCRAGGREPNLGTIDLNGLGARFLEQYRGDPSILKELIDRNRHDRGWLIFGTHDISSTPSRFGCTPQFFEDIVRYAVQSGARVLPIVDAYKLLAGGTLDKPSSRQLVSKEA